MKKALIICAAGMSSSMMAAKTTDWFKQNGYDITMDAVGATEGAKWIETSDFDLFLVSPQTKMYLKTLQASGEKVGKPVISIPPQAYVPIPSGIKNMGELVLKNMPK
jgi:PTS system cellobiose-specific IIB component